MEIHPSWLHKVASENQQRLEGNSLGQIGCLNIGTVIRGLQGSCHGHGLPWQEAVKAEG